MWPGHDRRRNMAGRHVPLKCQSRTGSVCSPKGTDVGLSSCLQSQENGYRAASLAPIRKRWPPHSRALPPPAPTA